MALLELEKTRGDVQSLPKVESTEPTVLYDRFAAKTLASEFLINRSHELRLKGEISTLHAEDAYVRGKMDARAMVLTMIGQVHVLALDPNRVEVNEPPMMDIRPLNFSQIDLLLKSYQEARKYLIDHNFSGKPIRKISPQEARARGQMIELGKCLVNLGQNKALEAIDGDSKSHTPGNGGGELQ